MIIAHAPAGYLLSKVFPKSWQTKGVVSATIIGSFAPDFDFIFNILRLSNLNHRFFITHTPFFWIVSYSIALIINKKVHVNSLWIHGFFIGTLLHIALDIPTGIRVLYPFSDSVTNWFPLVYSSRLSVIQTLLHPYVLAEIGIIVLMLLLVIIQRLPRPKIT